MEGIVSEISVKPFHLNRLQARLIKMYGTLKIILERYLGIYINPWKKHRTFVDRCLIRIMRRTSSKIKMKGEKLPLLKEQKTLYQIQRVLIFMLPAEACLSITLLRDTWKKKRTPCTNGSLEILNRSTEEFLFDKSCKMFFIILVS